MTPSGQVSWPCYGLTLRGSPSSRTIINCTIHNCKTWFTVVGLAPPSVLPTLFLCHQSGS